MDNVDRRRLTVSKKNHMFYMWDVLQYFDEFHANLEVLMQILIAYAMKTKDQGLAFLMRAACATGNRLFKESVMACPPENPVVVTFVDALPPLFGSFKDKLAWSFQKCQFCLRNRVRALSGGFVCLDNSTRYKLLVCDLCVPHGTHILRHIIKTASGCLMIPNEGDKVVAGLKDLLATARITARHVGTHIWVRGFPLPGTTPRSVHVLLTEVLIDREDGRKPLRLQIPLRREHHDAAFGKGAIRKSTVSNFKPIFYFFLLRGGGHALLKRVLTWDERWGDKPAPNLKKRKAVAPPKLKCTHCYNAPLSNAFLKSCSFCTLPSSDSDDDDDE